MMRRVFFSLLLLVGLAGCKIIDHSGYCRDVTESAVYCLQPVPEHSFSRVHMVHIQRRGLDERAIVQLENRQHSSSFNLAVLSPVGQSLLTLEWNGQTLQAQSMFGKRITRYADHFMMALQWLEWPEDKVIQGIKGAPAFWRHDGKSRSLVVEGKDVITEETLPSGERRVDIPGVMQFTLMPLQEPDQEGSSS